MGRNEAEKIVTASLHHTLSSSHFSTKLVLIGAQDQSLALD
jgi:hypothetical protein